MSPDRAGRVSGTLYGSVVAGSLIAVTSLHAEETGFVVIPVLSMMVVYWLTHVYVDVVGERLAEQGQPIHVRMAVALRANTEVLAGSSLPLVVFLAARVLGAELLTAAGIAVWATALQLAATGGLAGYLAGARGWRLAIEVAVAGGLGIAVVALQQLLH